MTVHKLTAGSGYEYLTRQVAALDATDKGHTGLADYYEAKGEAPGHWVGSGMSGVTGLHAGDAVTAEQMFNLFGLGMHPLADDLEAQHDAAADAREAAGGRRGDARERRRAGWLGKPYAVHRNDVTPLQIEVARRVTEAGEPPAASRFPLRRGHGSAPRSPASSSPPSTAAPPTASRSWPGTWPSRCGPGRRRSRAMT